MFGIETRGRDTVPDRAMPAGGPAPGEPARRAAPAVPVAILLAGFALNLVWLVLLGWTAFRVVRWLFA